MMRCSWLSTKASPQPRWAACRAAWMYTVQARFLNLLSGEGCLMKSWKMSTSKPLAGRANPSSVMDSAVATHDTASVDGVYAPCPARKAVSRTRTSPRTLHSRRQASIVWAKASRCKESGMSILCASRAACRRCTCNSKKGTWPDVKRMDSKTPSDNRNARLSNAKGRSACRITRPSTRRVSMVATVGRYGVPVSPWTSRQGCGPPQPSTGHWAQ